MTTGSRWTSTFLITGAMTLFATVASPQSVHHGSGPARHHERRHQAGQDTSGDRSMAATIKLGLTRMTAVDADIDALVADMNMFTGETKIATMARVLTLLVERQSIMRGQVTAMYELLMQSMGEPIAGPIREAPPQGEPAEEIEPGTMCIERPF